MSNQNTPQEPTKSAALQRIDNLKVALNEDYIQNQLKAALADNSAGFMASVIDLYTSEKYLQECDPKQVIMQAMKAAVLRLPVIKSLGYAYVVAYKGIPSFQIGYKGLIQLAIRSGEYRHINADVVYDGEYRTSNKLTGEYDLNGQAKSDKVIGYFAYFELKNGFSKTLYMTKERVDGHAKKYSKSYNTANTPWKNEFDAMSIKTVLRLLLTKWGYLSADMIKALDDDDDMSEKVQNEIDKNANGETLGFTDAEVVGSNVNQTAGAPF